MSNEELVAEVERQDGVQKALLIAIRALLRSEPAVKVTLQQYSQHLRDKGGEPGLSAEQNQAMLGTLEQISGLRPLRPTAG
jgi:hypothetical protein